MQATAAPAGADSMGSACTATLTGMKEGFYNKHSDVQASVVSKVQPHLISAAHAIELPADRPVQVAEFGCSHGSNSVEPVRAVLGVLQERVSAARGGSSQQPLLDVVVSHEDLPTNSWNELIACTSKYMDDPTYSSLHVSSAMIGRSFYQRCFPSAHLHMGFSMSSLHWLSRRACPLTTSIFAVDPLVPEAERAAWRANAMADLTNFLQLRAQEFVPGGMLVLCYGARMDGPDSEPSSRSMLRTAYLAVHSMADEGLLTQQELGNMSLPMYAMSAEEQDRVYTGVADLWEVMGEKQYILTSPPDFASYMAGDMTAEQLGQAHSDFWRAVSEDIMLNGLRMTRTEAEAQRLVDEYFSRVAADEAADPQLGTFPTVVVVLRRRR